MGLGFRLVVSSLTLRGRQRASEGVDVQECGLQERGPEQAPGHRASEVVVRHIQQAEVGQPNPGCPEQARELVVGQVKGCQALQRPCVAPMTHLYILTHMTKPAHIRAMRAFEVASLNNESVKEDNQNTVNKRCQVPGAFIQGVLGI